MHPVQQVVNKGVQIRKGMDIPSSMEGNVLHGNNAGETDTSLSTLMEQDG